MGHFDMKFGWKVTGNLLWNCSETARKLHWICTDFPRSDFLVESQLRNNQETIPRSPSKLPL